MPSAVPRRSSGNRCASEVSLVPGIGSRPGDSSAAEMRPRPNHLPRTSRTPHSTRVATESASPARADASQSTTSSNSSAVPSAGSPQTSSTVKSGAISRIRQGREVWTVLGSLPVSIRLRIESLTPACICQYGAV